MKLNNEELIIKWLARARQEAIIQHGELTHDVGRALHIMTEEVGECHAAYLAMTRPGAQQGAWIDLANELTQLIGVASTLLEIVVEDYREKGK